MTTKSLEPLKLARHININTETGDVIIDGEPLGYYIAEGPIAIDVPGIDARMPRKVTLTLLAERVTISPDSDGR